MVDSARIGGSSPSFLHSLSLIGQYFNQQRARLVTIAEVDTGFLLYYFPEGDWRKPRSVAVQHTDLLELSGPFGGNSGGRKGVLIKGGDNRDKRHTLFPMGYDLFFRILGYKLDRRKATGLTICEMHDKIFVNYWLDKATFVIRDQRRQAVSSVQVETYDANAVTALIDSTQQGLAAEMLRYDQGIKMNQYDHVSTLAAAFMLENDGNYRDAEALMTRIVSNVREHPEAHYHLARLAISRGDRHGAMAAIRRALKIREDLAPLHDLHGRVLRQLNKHKDAVASFEQAVKLDPEHGIYHYHLGKAYEAVGRKEEAAAELALSAAQHAAPAWDMVQEEMSVEVQAVPSRLTDLAGPMRDESPAATALLPALHESPAASALLPPLPKEETAEQPGLEPAVFHADWGASVERAARQTGDGSTPAQPGAPTPPMTAFEGTPAPWPQGAPAAPIAQVAQATPTWPQQQPSPPPAGWVQQPAPGWSQAQAQAAQASGPTWAPQQQPAPPPGWEQQSAPTWPQAQQQPPLTPFPAAPMTPVAQPPAGSQGWSETQAATPQAADMQAAARESVTPPTQAPAAPLEPAQAPSPSQVLTLEQRLRTTVGNAPAPAPDETTGQTTMPRPTETTGATQSADLAASGTQPEAAVPATPTPVPMETAGGANAVEIAAEIMMIQRALEAEPNRADLHRKLGFLLARQGKTAEAATEFRKALQCSRTSL